MIKTFRCKGLQLFFERGEKSGIQPHHESRLRKQLTALNVAKMPKHMDFPGWGLHSLSRDLLGFWAVKVNGNWRLIFKFDGEDVVLVDYVDYH